MIHSNPLAAAFDIISQDRAIGIIDKAGAMTARLDRIIIDIVGDNIMVAGRIFTENLGPVTCIIDIRFIIITARCSAGLFLFNLHFEHIARLYIFGQIHPEGFVIVFIFLHDASENIFEAFFFTVG